MSLTTYQDFGGEFICIVPGGVTITADAGNTYKVCEDQTFTVAVATGSAPFTYAWSTAGLVSGQGTTQAVYNFHYTCSPGITCTVSNACGSAVSATTFLFLELTLADIAEAMQDDFEAWMSPSLLERVYGWDELPEGVQDPPALMIYWQSIQNDALTNTDRTTFDGNTKVKEIVFHVDYYAGTRNHLDENNERLMQGANEIIDLLETEIVGGCNDGGHCPPFGLCALKEFRWEGERVIFDYGGVLFYGARFRIIFRVY